MQLKSVIFLIVCMVFFMSCKKSANDPVLASNTNSPTATTSSPPKPTKTIYISNELKQWAYFDVGTYWIYKDSTDNSLDSIYVYNVTSEFKTYPAQDTNRIYEEIRIWFRGYTVDLDWILKENGIERFGGKYSRMRVFDLDTSSIAQLPAYGANKNYSISNFNVLNTNYGNVRCFGFKYFFNGYNHTPSFDYYEINYWKKNIGIVKKLAGQYSDYSSSLLRYNIVQ